MKSLQDLINERKESMKQWAETHVDTSKQYRITAYPDMGKISVEVYSPATNKYYNVHTESI